VGEFRVVDPAGKPSPRPATASPKPQAFADDPTATKVAVLPQRYQYALKVRSLDGKGDADAGGEASPADGGSLWGPPLAALLSLPVGSSSASEIVVTQKALQADDRDDADSPSPAGACRIRLWARWGDASPRTTAVATIRGTYHESMDVASRSWDGDRMPLWRYHTADGHGGQYTYEVTVERRPRE